MRDPYSVLGVSRSADQDTIRKAYKKLARQYHPDLNKDPKAVDHFKEINSAYDMIGDEEKRKLYNDFGETAFKPGFDAARAREWQRASGGFGGFGPGGVGSTAGMGGMGGFGSMGGMGGGGRRGGQRVQVDFDNFGFGNAGAGPGGMDMEDLLNMFGGGGAGGPRGSARRGSDQESVLQIDLKEALEGTTATVPTISARGGVEGLRVQVPPGIHEGGTIRLRGKGRPSALPGGEPGDLLIKIEIREHPLLKREGDNLLLEVPLTVQEALTGPRIEVPTLDGALRVKVPVGVTNGQRLRLRGKGMPLKGGGRGDLYLVLRPTLPEVSDDPRLLELAEAMQALYSQDVRAALKL